MGIFSNKINRTGNGPLKCINGWNHALMFSTSFGWGFMFFHEDARFLFRIWFRQPVSNNRTHSGQSAVTKICQFIIYLLTAGCREAFIQKRMSGNVQTKVHVCASAPSDAWMFWIKKIYLLWSFCVGEESSGCYLDLKVETWKRREGIGIKCKVVCLKFFFFFVGKVHQSRKSERFTFYYFYRPYS